MLPLVKKSPSPVVSHIKIHPHLCLERFFMVLPCKWCLVCADFSPDSGQTTFHWRKHTLLLEQICHTSSEHVKWYFFQNIPHYSLKSDYFGIAHKVYFWTINTTGLAIIINTRAKTLPIEIIWSIRSPFTWPLVVHPNAQRCSNQRWNAANSIMLVNYRINMIETAEYRLVINYTQMLESFLNAS